jgi:hypothetical protein
MLIYNGLEKATNVHIESSFIWWFLLVICDFHHFLFFLFAWGHKYIYIMY